MHADRMMPERVLITGVAGFSGRHLARRLSGDDTHVVGLGRAMPAAAVRHIAEFRICDLTDRAAIEPMLESVRPNTVYHLAGLTLNNASLKRLTAANVDSLRNLLDGLRTHAARSGCTIRMLVVGSAAELGTTGAASLPVREDATCDPESPYGRSKFAAVRLALAEPMEGPLKIVVARAFNLVGPGLGSGLALGRFAEQIAAVMHGDAPQLECGSLATRRDYIDVRDAVALYVRLLRFGTPGEIYNVCRGRSHGMRELLHLMIERTGRRIAIIENRGPARPGDLADIYGDMTKTIACCGPIATTPIERSLADLVDAAILQRNPTDVARLRGAA